MPTHSSSPIRIAVLLCATLTSALTGCSSTTTHPGSDLLPLDKLRPPPATESVDSAESPGNLPASPEVASSHDDDLVDLLTQPDGSIRSSWIRSVPSPDGGEPSYRWIYPDLDSMFFAEATDPPDLRSHLKSDHAVVAANAAIGLVRMGDPSAADHLAKAVGNVQLDVQLRCAAAETLGRTPAGTVLLQRLEDEATERANRAGSSYSAIVHAELIRALGRLVRPTDEPRLTSALTTQADEVKLAALDVWQQTSEGFFPKQGLVLRNHRDPKIRARLLAALVRHPSDNTFDQLTFALSDPNLQVRSAAIRAMGELGDERAVATLEQLLNTGVEAEKIAAVRALAELGETESVAGGARDKAWRVRLAVAEMLPNLPEPDVALAKKLLDDKSAEVQHQAVTALQIWPPHIAEPLLLDALEKCPFRSQKLAAESLATTWTVGRPLLEAFPFGQPAKARARAIDEIRQAYADRSAAMSERTGKPDTADTLSFPREQLVLVMATLRTLQSTEVTTPEHAEAIASLRGVGPSLVDILEHLIVQRGVVLPECVFVKVLAAEMPDFAMVELLGRDDLQVRRRAARKFADVAARLRLRPLLLRRLADLAVTETDAVVWQYVLAALREQDDSQTFRLVYAAVGHDSAGIRLAACEHLGRHPLPQHANVLVATLNDTCEPVVCAALDGLGFCKSDVDPAPIVQLLRARSESLQIAAAKTLARLGSSKGPAALERLAYSPSEHTRLRVAQAMGELALPEFAPTLIRLLDDRHSIRLAALRSLPCVAECVEADEAGLSDFNQIEVWRRWASGANLVPRGGH